MSQVHVREARSEVLVFLDRHCPDHLTAMKEAAKILEREAMREEAKPNRNANWKPDDSL